MGGPALRRGRGFAAGGSPARWGGLAPGETARPRPPGSAPRRAARPCGGAARPRDGPPVRRGGPAPPQERFHRGLGGPSLQPSAQAAVPPRPAPPAVPGPMV
ncbi:hypothetical protein GCM10023214_76590 [Amycolatopsis dongchuanensis]|uniref:Uncharacterized protein n=1 Tax=Amycolatopsis dongchuanensis TaxID=1070866 RepID=A0ABP8VSA2_9PSEU